MKAKTVALGVRSIGSDCVLQLVFNIEPNGEVSRVEMGPIGQTPTFSYEASSRQIVADFLHSSFVSLDVKENQEE